jgi:Subtilisin inhibitor-like
MRLLAVVCLAASALAACGSAGSTVAPTSLTITARSGPGAKPIVRTLRCDPAGGTLVTPARACARLAAMSRPFAPTPKGVACTEIFGGLETATVRGTYRGRSIWANFARRNGCEIERWNRHMFLFPAGLGGFGP